MPQPEVQPPTTVRSRFEPLQAIISLAMKDISPRLPLDSVRVSGRCHSGLGCAQSVTPSGHSSPRASTRAMRPRNSARKRVKKGSEARPDKAAASESTERTSAARVNGRRPEFIDLFCGCGGFTFGLMRAGFDCVAAIDFDPKAVATLRENVPEVPHVLERDLTKLKPKRLAKVLGTDHVDVIVGGPPCQGFSTARQVDGSNHGRRLKHDPRRLLYSDFLRFVGFFKPSVFVMENVLGLRSAAGGEYLTRVQRDARKLGYRVHGQVEDA